MSPSSQRLKQEVEKWRAMVEARKQQDWDIIFGEGSYQRMIQAKAEGFIVVTEECEWCGN